MNDKKTCKRCGDKKTITEFRAVHNQYLDSHCHACRRILAIEYIQKNKVETRRPPIIDAGIYTQFCQLQKAGSLAHKSI